MNIASLRTTYRLERHVPLALVAGILLQAGIALWWAATQDSATRYQDLRLAALESRAESERQQGREMLDRLARIEERLRAQAGLLDDLKNLRH